MIFQGGRPRRLPFLVFDRPQQAIRQGSLHGAVPESCGRHDGSPTALRRQILSPSSIYVTAGLFALPASISRPCRTSHPDHAFRFAAAALPTVDACSGRCYFFLLPAGRSRRSLLTCGAHMDFKQLALAARTCRRFEEERPLQMADLEWLVDCARLTPCARNAQQLRYSLVGPGETCRRLFGMTKWAAALKDWGGPFPGERPTGFIVMSMPKNAGDLVWLDTGIAAQTIQLAASSRDWGCCMIASFDHSGVSELVQLPDDLRPTLVLGLGVAKEVRRVADVPESGALGYWRDAEQVHYVPKLALDKLILNRF